MKGILYFMIICCMAASCGVSRKMTRESQYPKVYDEKPITLLVMPPINNTTFAEAKDLLYTSIARPLAEAGYYVISPLLATDVLKAEGVYDSEKLFDAPQCIVGQHGHIILEDQTQIIEKGSFTGLLLF